MWTCGIELRGGRVSLKTTRERAEAAVARLVETIEAACDGDDAVTGAWLQASRARGWHRTEVPWLGGSGREWRRESPEFTALAAELLAGRQPDLKVREDEDEVRTLGDEVADLRVSREALVWDDWPEASVFVYRRDVVCHSRERYLVWNSREFAKLRICKDSGHVRFWLKENTSRAGKRGRTVCRWASLRNWPTLAKACAPFCRTSRRAPPQEPLRLSAFDSGAEAARELLSLRPDQEWLRCGGTMVPYERYDVSNATRRGVTNLQAFYSLVLGERIGPQLAKLPLRLARSVIAEFTREERDLVVPVLAADPARTVCLYRSQPIVTDVDATAMYFKLKLERESGHSYFCDYARLCRAAGVRPRLRARSWKGVASHHDELAAAAAEARRRLDAEARRALEEGFHADPIFDVLEPDARYEVEYVTTFVRLEEEGRAMHHCVGGYHGVVTAGQCGIWSVRAKDGSGRWTCELGLVVGAVAVAAETLRQPTSAKALEDVFWPASMTGVGPAVQLRQMHGPCNAQADMAALRFVAAQLEALLWDAAEKRFTRR